jgi:hypothetical protein
MSQDDTSILRRRREAGLRAKAEAEARRKASEEMQALDAAPPEIGGRKGPEPTRYGDWEIKGLISDF